MEKKITGAITIYSAFMNMVFTGLSRYPQIASVAAAGSATFSSRPKSRPSASAASVARSADCRDCPVRILALFRWFLWLYLNFSP